MDFGRADKPAGTWHGSGTAGHGSSTAVWPLSESGSAPQLRMCPGGRRNPPVEHSVPTGGSTPGATAGRSSARQQSGRPPSWRVGTSTTTTPSTTRSASATAPRRLSPVGADHDAAEQARHRMEIDPRWAAQSARPRRGSGGTVAREELSNVERQRRRRVTASTRFWVTIWTAGAPTSQRARVGRCWSW
jgi:hypothetical protein